VIDQTPEGLRIQIVDREGKQIFASGSSRMEKPTRQLLAKITQVVKKLPNKISVTGHTDATPVRGSRRVMVESGLKMENISHASRKEATEPMIKKNPKDARNRRIAIIVLREAGENAKSDKANAAKSTEKNPPLSRQMPPEIPCSPTTGAAPG